MAVAVGLLIFAFNAFGPSVQTAAAYTWVWPTTGRVTQPFGCTGFYAEPPYGSCRHFHKGVDIANDAWTKIRAASSGVVTYVGWNPYDPSCCRAWIVTIKHDNGLVGWYAHMKAVYVTGARKGDRVWAGKLIGYMGATGMATGVHLHFGLMNGSVPVSPRNYIGTSCCSTSSTTSALDFTDAGFGTVDLDGPAQPAIRPDQIVLTKRYPAPA
jgi:murein DD-endopeptidase MepM/ murein hydrolase activator NlpD